MPDFDFVAAGYIHVLQIHLVKNVNTTKSVLYLPSDYS